MLMHSMRSFRKVAKPVLPSLVQRPHELARVIPARSVLICSSVLPSRSDLAPSGGAFSPMGSVRGFAMRLPMRNFYREPPQDIQPIPIAIVGRPNVGKSTLFNRLQSGTKKKRTPIARAAIVSDRAGTTRDRKDSLAVLGGLLLRVTDTGGLEGPKAVQESTLLQSMEEQVWKAIAEAEAVLFVIDAKEGITAVDMHIAKLLHEGAAKVDRYRDLFKESAPRGMPPIILVANKAEGSYIGPYLNDCYEMNLGDPVVISAQKNEGIDELYDRLYLEVGHLQAEQQDDEAEELDEEVDEEEGISGQSEQSDEGSDADEDVEGGAHLGSGPTLSWMPHTPLSEERRRALKWYANHPADPLGRLDMGLKAHVQKDYAIDSDVPKYWLKAPQRALPDKASRDFVLKQRRAEEMEKALRLCIIGQPSAGKSSIINALLREERCIVDETDGTTMDAIVSDWTFKDHPVKLIDTCGVYRGWQYPGTTSEFLEPGMGTRKAIRRSHVAVLCIDAQRYRKMTYNSCPTKFEIRLGNFVAEEGKCLIIAVNKWDLINEEDQPKYREEILKRVADTFSDVKGVPVVFMSAKYNLNLATLMTRTFALYKRWSARLPTSRLNTWLQAWMLRWPPPWRNGQKCSVKYITQTRARPPTFVLWTNSSYGEFPRNYLRQLQNNMRDEFRISGVPMRYLIRSTLMPKPRKKLSKSEILKWKRMGPKQAEVVRNLNSKKMKRIVRTID
eukprot:TRINITY_DN110943_c0_g1_i1.p1 TRINITY_DN110943_c0_g1~~TRINITY_DN110943_c0_g1_i1.p1  ORF type:complete len:728 (-),score=136.50 TRINITY_DN110943_c0_g1_i1:151-2334(-)